MVKIIYSTILLFLAVKVSPQTYQLSVRADNSRYWLMLANEQLRDLDSLYIAETGIEKDFINGKDYRQNYYRSSVTPLLRTGEERTASLLYRSREYSNINLQYDTFLDELICTDNSLVYDNTVHQVSLNSDNVSEFKLFFAHDTLVFRYFSDITEPGFNLGKGYYEVVYDGLSKFLIKHVSVHYKLQGVDEYSYKPESYVKTGEQYSKIKGKKDFLLLFGSKSKEVSHFLTENKIKIKRADKNSIASVLRFYEHTLYEEKD